MSKPTVELTEEMKALKKRERSDIVTQTRKYKLITPLFGGGVTPNQMDEVTPIRGTAVRGHLRFWWRATRGGQEQFEGNLEKMKAKEDEIWGSAVKKQKKKDEERPLPVQIAIRIDNAGSPDEPFIHKKNKKGNIKSVVNYDSDTPSYAAFPLRRPDKEAEAGKLPYTVQKGIAFTMDITFHTDHRKDVEAALWAWEIFGGIGARTRRGFGALDCFLVEENGQTFDPRSTIANLKANLENDLEKHLDGGDEFPDHIPHLGAEMEKHIAITHAGGSGNGVTVWISLIEALQAFRHKRPQNKVTEGNRTFIRPGRNRWPEPDAIRDKEKPRNRRYPDTIHNPPIDKAPRAAFGLPIIFEFKGERTMPNVTLAGADKDHNRFASPLILRSLACQDDRCVGIALMLAGSDVNDIPGGLVLDGVRGNPSISAQLTKDEAQQIAEKAKQIDSNDEYDGDPDILQAFLATLEE